MDRWVPHSPLRKNSGGRYGFREEIQYHEIVRRLHTASRDEAESYHTFPSQVTRDGRSTGLADRLDNVDDPHDGRPLIIGDIAREEGGTRCAVHLGGTEPGDE